MWYLITELWLYLLIAAIIGIITGWVTTKPNVTR